MRKHRLIIRAGIIGIIVLAILAGVLIYLDRLEKAESAGKEDDASSDLGQLRIVELADGTKYREKPAVTTLLIAGIDKTEDSRVTGSKAYRSGGQADFLVLIAIDHTDKVIHQLQIDRDTMTEVTTLGVFGNETGTRVMQICLSHAFGETKEDNAKYTVQAVQRLLDGLEIDGYYMVNYNAVPVLNDALGGVTVDIAFDMTSENPAWTKGTTVTLHGKEAEAFVRARKTVGEGTNEERMVRQNEFMRKAIRQMNQKISEDSGFADSLLEMLSGISTSNMPTKRLAEELYKAHSYEVMEVSHPDGEYSIGSDGFMEFHMKDGAAVEWVLENLYTRME